MILKIGLAILITGILLMTPLVFLGLKLIVRDFLDDFKSDPEITAYSIGCLLLITGLLVSAIGMGIRYYKRASQQATHDVPVVIVQTQKTDQ